jgi:type VI secretion system protein ImpA
MLTHELVRSTARAHWRGIAVRGRSGVRRGLHRAHHAAQGKPEQQFGDTVIPAVEPEWREVAEQSDALLRRSKDVRPAVLLLRASTRLQGVAGFVAGLELLTGLLDKFWEGIHPKLDADDDNDPTMRLNALAPLGDEAMVLRDLYDAQVGIAPGVGPIRVRDIAIANNALNAVGGEATYSSAQIHGGLEALQAERPEQIQAAIGVLALIEKLQALLVERTGRADVRSTWRRCAPSAARAAQGLQRRIGAPEEPMAQRAVPRRLAHGRAAAPRTTAARGEIQNRQDALQTLDRVIRFLEQTEPGNPAPL